MTQAYKACKTPGISFKEHDTRKNGKLKDRYFRIRYRLNRRNITEALGWSTQGMTEQKASAILSQLKENIRLGKHPQTVAEMRAIDKQAQRQEEQEKIEVEAERITFSEVWKKYIEVQKTCVTRRHLSTEQSYYKTWIMPKLSKLKLTNITIDDVQNVISEVLDKRSPKTACHIRAIIRQVFNFAIGRELYYKKNPASEIKIKLNDNKRNRYLTLDEAKILLN
ncbi:MAG: hypothetical protein IJ730_06315 [Alphaproteobacteria bacterium]|nr:hypothetical protein [Alphaproteobacteria bacterium]